MEARGQVIPGPEEILRTKKMIKEILKMEKEKQQLKDEKKKKKQSMKQDKETLKSALEEIGSNKKLNDKDNQYVIRKVPGKWYGKKTLKILLQAIETTLGKEGLEKIKQKMKEKRKQLLAECTNIEYKVVIEDKEQTGPTAKKRKPKSKQKKVQDPAKKRQRFIQKLEK